MLISYSCVHKSMRLYNYNDHVSAAVKRATEFVIPMLSGIFPIQNLSQMMDTRIMNMMNLL